VEAGTIRKNPDKISRALDNARLKGGGVCTTRIAEEGGCTRLGTDDDDSDFNRTN